MRARILTLVGLLLLAGCSSIPSLLYKIEIQQGNVITQEMVNKLKPGMTRSQVRFALGSPMISDAFHENRWDYVYRLEQKGNWSSKETWQYFLKTTNWCARWHFYTSLAFVQHEAVEEPGLCRRVKEQAGSPVSGEDSLPRRHCCSPRYAVQTISPPPDISRFQPISPLRAGGPALSVVPASGGPPYWVKANFEFDGAGEAGRRQVPSQASGHGQ